ncbi:uncharacterized protein LOC133191113 [Saccostrea echinata]|uniref:uncharacterized protein LOC133191113 n=1 Tax=Saccostrea echinata TaxID=191078 RepID=UPI002A823E53|nr:uncharacterized protein LOC133191113 [Saccostrea echinata]
MLLPEMDPREKATLKNCLNCFLEDLDPTLTFLSQLVCSGIITEDQKDRIEKQTTRQDKVITLLEILPRRGPRAFKKFVGLLRIDYSWISEKLEQEYQVQDFTKRIENALEQRTKKMGELIKDRDYINRVITETVVPLMIEECGSSSSGGAVGPGFDAPLKDIITDHLIPLLNGNNGLKTHLDSMHSGMLLDKVVDIIQELKEKCCKMLSLSDVTEFHSSLPILIDTRLQELRDNITSMKKENKKMKKIEEKLTAENQKLKNDLTIQRAEVKKGKTDVIKQNAEIKKLKDQVQKSKSESDKLKQELANLREQMSKAGMDLQISSDFT